MPLSSLRELLRVQGLLLVAYGVKELGLKVHHDRAKLKSEIVLLCDFRNPASIFIIINLMIFIT